MRPTIEPIWSPAARQDLIDIWEYFLTLASPDIADGLVVELNDAAATIAENSHGWRERPDLLRGIHAFPVHPYTIFYRVNDNIPEIVRILHERRDTSHILAGGAN
jgi:toxin ParE1/3/4